MTPSSSVPLPAFLKRVAGKFFASGLAVFLFVVAIFVLHQLLARYQLEELIQAFHSVPPARLWLCGGFSLLSYLLLAGNDALALRYLHKPLTAGKILFTSFICYAFANNTGSLSIIASSGVRYRLYGAWGFSGQEISKLIGFGLLSFWLGIFSLAGLTFLLEPLALPPLLPLLPAALSLSPLALLALVMVGGYLLLCVLRKKPIRLKTLRIPLPAAIIAWGQIGLAVADLLVVGAALYLLLPATPTLHFTTFIGLFLIALLTGLISNVPGGLGVFESVLLLLLSPYVQGPAVIGALLVFRGVYFLLPLGVAVLLLSGVELHQRRSGLTRLASGLNRVTVLLLPQLLALAIFMGGALLLLSGTTPPADSRLARLTKFLPLVILEFSHFLSSIAGMGLMVLASGLLRRLDMAYLLAVILLVSGILFSLLKGLEYEASLWLTVLLLALVSSRRQFYRPSSLLAEPLAPGWLGAGMIVLAGSLWLGLFAYRHHQYSHELWWQFALHGDAPRFMRAMVGGVTVMVLVTLLRIFKPIQSAPLLPTEGELVEAAAIIGQSPQPEANLALLGDKTLLFSESRKSFLMYAVRGKSWIAMGDPIGLETEFDELLWQFRDLCESYGGWAVFYEVGKEQLANYIDLGLNILKIGEAGRVSLPEFTLDGSDRRGLRYIHNRFQKEGYSFQVIPPEGVAKLLPELKLVSDGWLAAKKGREKGFSLGFFNERYLCRFPVALVRKGNDLLAFANLWPGAGRQRLAIDLMRYRPEAASGLMEFLFVELMLWGRGQGYQWFCLAMAPLAGLERRKRVSRWHRLGAFIYRHGEFFYNFKGLRRYKDKFAPVWEPKYLVYPGGLHLPAILANLTTLIGGGVKGVFLK